MCEREGILGFPENKSINISEITQLPRHHNLLILVYLYYFYNVLQVLQPHRVNSLVTHNTLCLLHL